MGNKAIKFGMDIVFNYFNQKKNNKYFFTIKFNRFLGWSRFAPPYFRVGQIWPVKILKRHVSKLFLGSPISIVKKKISKKLIPCMIFRVCEKRGGAKLVLDTLVCYFILKIPC